jgi:hypothetical protein
VTENRVACGVDNAHPAATELSVDYVVPEAIHTAFRLARETSRLTAAMGRAA